MNRHQPSACVASFEEPWLHAAFLGFFLLTQGMAWQNDVAAFRIHPVDVIWLTLLGGGLALAMRGGRPLMRALVFGLYALLVAELIYRHETGLFFSIEQAAYAWRKRAELGGVLWQSSRHQLLTIGLWALAFAGLPMVMRPGRLTRWIGTGLMLSLLLISTRAQTASLFSSLHAAPMTVASLKPQPYPYRPPRLLTVPVGSPKPPDILLIVLESTRASAVPGFGGLGPHARMPYLSSLMKQGMVYDRAYTTTTHTSKALVGMICGIAPPPTMDILSARRGGLGLPCLPDLLGQAGYRSLFLSSATGNFEHRDQLARNMGFQLYLGGESIETGFAESGYLGVDEMALVNPLKRWWQQPSTAPKLAVMLTSMTHHPYQRLGEPVPETVEERLRGYLGNLDYTDRMLSKLLPALAANHGLDNTVILVTADHGEGFGEHGRFLHDDTPFEEGIHVPMLLVDKRHPALHGRDHGLRQHIDFMPSLLAMTGLPYQAQLPGQSLLGPGHARVMTSCWNVSPCMTRLDADGGKWILFPDERRLARFDLRHDAGETRDVVATENRRIRSAVTDDLISGHMALQRFYRDITDRIARREAAKPARMAAPQRASAVTPPA